HRVSPRARWFWATRALLAWLVVGGIQVVILLNTHRPDAIPIGIIVATGVLAVAHIAVMPAWRYRVHRWEQTPTAVYTQTGWFTQERRIAPIARIQTVDTHRGPIEQIFRLTNVTVTTASAAGPLHIKGLERLDAERLVAELTDRTQASADDGT
ncbi:MAG: PH domain-containing protein, partial [Actinobacteria bacterium]|nr:PH domain-containing protein [Actinomycetota bacterium]